MNLSAPGRASFQGQLARGREDKDRFAKALESVAGPRDRWRLASFVVCWLSRKSLFTRSNGVGRIMVGKENLQRPLQEKKESVR
jgi:hypothetical protein